MLRNADGARIDDCDLQYTFRSAGSTDTGGGSGGGKRRVTSSSSSSRRSVEGSFATNDADQMLILQNMQGEYGSGGRSDEDLLVDDSGTTRASASAQASASVSHRLLFSTDARVASSAPFSKEAEGAEGSKAERDDGNSVPFEDEDEEEEADSDSNASRGRSDDEENAGETLIEAKCPVATHVEENGAAMAV